MNDEEQKCEECGERRATVHLTDVKGDTAVERHLCEQCYVEKETDGPPRPVALFAQLIAAVAPELQNMSARQCPVCGLSDLEFRRTLQLGCSNDYQFFGETIEHLLERSQGATRHCGKIPPGIEREEAVRERLRFLRERQGRAINDENYELAAKLRDRIRELQKHGPDEPEG